MRLSLAVAALVAGVLLPSLAEAQKRCVKGIPCGNTCISASKTCRVGSGSATRAPAPPREATPPPREVPTARPSPAMAAAAAGPIDLRASSDERFVGLAGGTVYYLATCQAATELPSEFLVRYDSEAAAQRDRRTRSKVPGC